MKTHLSRAFLLLPLIFLTSCGSAKNVAISDYFDETIAYKSDFRLLQLTDLHWSVNTNAEKAGAYLTQVVKTAKPDFVMITGDLLLGATTSTAKALVSVIDSWDVPFGVTWGNHDREGEYSPAWLSKLFMSAKNSHYHEVDDDVFGRSNYVVSLMNPLTKKAAWNIYAIDSNSYPESKTGIYYDYDVIHDDQISWFKKAAAYSTQQNGTIVPGISYFHIPLFQWYYAYLQNQKGLMGEILETSTNSLAPADIKKQYADQGLKVKFWPGYKDTGYFDAGVQNGVKGFFCGHDHSNDWGETYSDSAGKAYIGYGVKSSKELYYTHGSDTRGYMRNYDIIGGSVSILHDNGNFDLEHYYVQMDENYTTYSESLKGANL